MKKWLVLTIIILGMALGLAVKQANTANKRWKDAALNVKAYSEELSKEKDKSTAYKFTIEQLEYLNDSVVRALNKTREDLKIKDKYLQSLQAITTTLLKTDTVVFKDTIFSLPSLAVDTVVGDMWYSVSMKLRYPSYIEVSPCFNSEKHIVVSTRKETVNPPKKFFLFRWFQKKHKVLQVDVVEKNPYIENQTSKYIEIIK